MNLLPRFTAVAPLLLSLPLPARTCSIKTASTTLPAKTPAPRLTVTTSATQSRKTPVNVLKNDYILLFDIKINNGIKRQGDNDFMASSLWDQRGRQEQIGSWKRSLDFAALKN